MKHHSGAWTRGWKSGVGTVKGRRSGKERQQNWLYGFKVKERSWRERGEDGREEEREVREQKWNREGVTRGGEKRDQRGTQAHTGVRRTFCVCWLSYPCVLWDKIRDSTNFCDNIIPDFRVRLPLSLVQHYNKRLFCSIQVLLKGHYNSVECRYCKAEIFCNYYSTTHFCLSNALSLCQCGAP